MSTFTHYIRLLDLQLYIIRHVQGAWAGEGLGTRLMLTEVSALYRDITVPWSCNWMYVGARLSHSQATWSGLGMGVVCDIYYEKHNKAEFKQQQQQQLYRQF